MENIKKRVAEGRRVEGKDKRRSRVQSAPLCTKTKTCYEAS